MVYNFLDHTADVKFHVESETLEEAFKDSVKALKETSHGNINILNLEKKDIKIEGTDIINLFYKFLEEFIFLLDSENFLVSEINEIKIDQENFLIHAKISGDKADHYSFTNDVKAITYNEMIVKKENDKWITEAVLDV